MTALIESERMEDEQMENLALAVRAAMWAEDEKFRSLFNQSGE